MITDTDRQFLRRAIELAWSAVRNGNHPFGAVLVGADGAVMAEAENTVVTEHNCLGHAETNLVRDAYRRFSAEELAEATLYASTEPCPMCSGAIFWTNIRRVVFALDAASMYQLNGFGPEQLTITCRTILSQTQRPITVLGPDEALRDEAAAPHRQA